MRVIVDTLAEALGKRPLPGRVPASMAVGLSRIISWLPIQKLKGLHATVEKWLTEDVYDTRRFKEAYGFEAEVDIKKGLRREVEWFRSTGWCRSAQTS
jgi:nucleoside-diphosphate-sugar epimerase